MQFTSYLEDGRLTVALTGEIDHHCAKEYIKAIVAKIDSYAPDVCILDFTEVSKQTMENAVRIGEYFLEHAKAAYSLMGADPVNKQSEYLLDAIKRGQVSEFSRRDAMRMCRRFHTTEALQPVLNRLCEYGYIAPKPTESVPGVGRRPSEVYLTNPILLAS